MFFISGLWELHPLARFSGGCFFHPLARFRGTVLISGETDSFNAVNTIQQQLEAEPMFKSVNISSANQQKTGNRVNFRIRITL